MLVSGVVATLVFVMLSWVALYAAAIARRRLHLCTDQPMTALWETIGAAGDPPRDQSFNVAVYAIALLILAAALIPVAIGFIVQLG